MNENVYFYKSFTINKTKNLFRSISLAFSAIFEFQARIVLFADRLRQIFRRIFLDVAF